MDSELDVIDALNALDYTGRCLQKEELMKALDGGVHSAQFRDVVAWLTQQIHMLKKTDESVSQGLEDAAEFGMELSAMLKELSCPFSKFVTGSLSDRFNTKEDCVQLLDYLTTELMATKMSLRLKPPEESYIITKNETNTAKAMENLAKNLGLGKPPENVTPKAYFDKLNFKVEELIRLAKPNTLSEPLLKVNQPLNEKQWKKLATIQEDLDKEYNLRRQMLLTRLEVTIQSFQWSDKLRVRENEIVERYQHKLKELEPYKCGGTDTDLVALLAARTDLAIIEKTSAATVRKNTFSKIQKHIIGSVPDRGGRANEHAPPPPEMPSWQQQRAGGPLRGGGSGGGFGGARGSFNNRGNNNWQQNSQPQRQYQQHNQHSYQQQYQNVQSQSQDQSRNQHWIQGSGRVQGTGWTQGGQGPDQQYNNYQGNKTNARGGGGYRGRSNYNRGGSRH